MMNRANSNGQRQVDIRLPGISNIVNQLSNPGSRVGSNGVNSPAAGCGLSPRLANLSISNQTNSPVVRQLPPPSPASIEHDNMFK
jgi:hypothetical protein